MSNLLSYKNYNGTVEYSKNDNCLFGKIVGLKSLLSYEGDSVQELEQDFRNVIDEYLRDCAERNIEPEQHTKEALMSGSHQSCIERSPCMQLSTERV